MPLTLTDQLLQAAMAVQAGLATPAEVAEAAAGLPADGSVGLLAQLVRSGILDDADRARIEQQAARLLFAGRETLDLRTGAGLPEPPAAGDDRSATLDASSSQVADAADRFASGQLPDGSERTCRIQPGRYTIRKLHSRGGQARILLAFDEFIGREVAIKELVLDDGPGTSGVPGSDPASTRKRASKIHRFLREARVTGQLDHPNITPVHELGRAEDGTLYYSMRFVHGKTLGARLLECDDLAGRLGLLGSFWDLCNAISFAHDRGVIHRDIKPENVMVGEFGQTVVLDWGIAKVRGQDDERAREIERRLELLQADASHTLAGWALGTPAYMSPEQARGLVTEIDERSDVWSLGAVLYEILTGQAPFAGPSGREIILKVVQEPIRPLGQVCPEAPPELAAIAEKALAKDKSRRYGSAKELADEISAYMTGVRVAAYEYSSWELFRRFAARNQAAMLAAGLVLAVIIAALVLVTGAWGQATAARDRERAERLVANLHLAQGYTEKADRLSDQARTEAAQIFAAAALVHNPANRRGPYWDPAFASAHPASRDMLVTAASQVYRAGHSLRADPLAVLDAGSTVNRLAFTPDGRALAGVSLEGKLLVWQRGSDPGGPWQRRAASLLDGQAYSLAIRPDGSSLAVSTSEGTIQLRSLTTLEPILELKGHTGEVPALALSSDGRTLASGGIDHTVRLWDLDSGQSLRALSGHDDRIWALAFSPDGRTLASGSWDKTVRLWRVSDGRLLSTWTGHSDAIYALAYGPGGELASASWDKTLKVFDPHTGRERLSLQDSRDSLLDLAWSPDGQTLAAGGYDRVLRIWDAATGELLLGLAVHGDAVSALAFAPDSQILASAGYDKRVRIWRLDPSRRVTRFKGHADWVYGVRYSPDGTRLASASWDKSASLWELPGGRMLHRMTGHQAGLYALAFSPDGRRLASADSRGGLRIWDTRTGRCLHAIQAHDQWIYGLQFTPDGGRLATSGRDRLVRIWEVETGALLASLTEHAAYLYRLAFSPDGSLLATTGTDKRIVLFDARTYQPLRDLQGHTDWVSGLDFSSTGKLLVSGGRDARAILWEVESGRELRRLEWHKQWINQVRFSPDDSLLATASDDSTVVVWSALTGRPQLELRFQAAVVDVDFSPDGKSLAVGDGQDVAFYPLDFSALQADPRVLQAEAEQRLGLRLDGFELKALAGR